MKKNNDLFLLALLLIVVFWPGNPISPPSKVDAFEQLSNEGMVAIQYLSSDVGTENSPAPVPNNECKCGGKGYTMTGDGIHKIPCPKDCPCGCKPLKVQEEKIVGGINTSLPRQIIMFTASWCGPCQSFKTANPGKLSEDINAPIRMVDYDKNRNIYDIYGKGRPFPTFVLFENGVEKDFVTGNVSFSTVENLGTKTNKTTVVTQPQVINSVQQNCRSCNSGFFYSSDRPRGSQGRILIRSR